MSAVDTQTGEIIEDAQLVPYQAAPVTLFRSERPREVIAAATETANVLVEVVKRQRLTATIQGKSYPLVEAWTLCGSMLGVYPVCVWTRKLDDGWEARVEARTRDGAVVGAAEAQCTRSEHAWASREDYALRSMAQTRATSKALRQPLGFIMTLAGLEATPAEEMPKDEPVQVAAPEPSPFTPPPSVTGDKASAAQIKNLDRLLNKVTKAGIVDAVTLAERLQAKYGTSVPSQMTKSQASQVIDGLMKMAGEEPKS